MNSFFVALTVTASAMAGPAKVSPTWLEDYGNALRIAKAVKQPLLIVLDKPNEPKQRTIQVRLQYDRTEVDLLGHYQLCHIDATTPYGKAVAKAFGATEFPYTAITDKRGGKLLFTRAGRFTHSDWVATLASHKDGENKRRRIFQRENCFT